MFITEILVGILTILVISTYIFFKRKFRYWEQRNVPTIPDPIIPYGNVYELIKRKKTGRELGQSFYNYFKNEKNSKYGGIYFFGLPIFIPTDIELIRTILIKDFSHFVNHGVFHDESDPLSLNLFNIEDDKWRNLRAAMTHAFTSGKMKMMFKQMAEVSEIFEKIVEKSAEKRETINIKDYVSRYTMDVIASVALGLEINSLENPENNEFREYGNKIFKDNYYESLKLLVYFLAPSNWLKALGFKLTKPDVEKFFVGVLKSTVEYREKNKIERRDFLQMLIELKNSGIIEMDNVEEYGKIQKKYKMTMNDLIAQAFVFYVGGFETSSTTSTFALLELSLNQDIQDKVRDEIREVIEKYNGNLTYDALGEMNYLEQIIKETLRKYPPAATLTRVCNKEYKIPDSDVIIEEGTKVWIPVTGVHFDPELYENPDEFRPERFDETKKFIPNNNYFPFGEGPRTCIGMRLGVIQAKVALVTILKNHRVFLNEKKTIFPIQFEENFTVTSVRGGVWLDLTKIE